MLFPSQPDPLGGVPIKPSERQEAPAGSSWQQLWDCYVKTGNCKSLLPSFIGAQYLDCSFLGFSVSMGPRNWVLVSSDVARLCVLVSWWIILLLMTRSESAIFWCCVYVTVSSKMKALSVMRRSSSRSERRRLWWVCWDIPLRTTMMLHNWHPTTDRSSASSATIWSVRSLPFTLQRCFVSRHIDALFLSMIWLPNPD